MAIKFNEEMIRSVVSQVLAEVGPPPAVAANSTNTASSTFSYAGRNGVFYDAKKAVAAASEAFRKTFANHQSRPQTSD